MPSKNRVFTLRAGDRNRDADFIIYRIGRLRRENRRLLEHLENKLENKRDDKQISAWFFVLAGGILTMWTIIILDAIF